MTQVIVSEPKHKCRGTIVLLTGRGDTALNFLNIYKRNCNLNYLRIIAIQPEDEWYPIPNGIEDQEDSLTGINFSVVRLINLLDEIKSFYKIDKSKIFVCGFSAGGVMALQVAIKSNDIFGGFICHNGAILDCNSVSFAKNKTPILVIHSQDDDCFSWDERFIPMKQELTNKNYNVEFIENKYGGHFFSEKDIESALQFVSTLC